MAKEALIAFLLSALALTYISFYIFYYIRPPRTSLSGDANLISIKNENDTDEYRIPNCTTEYCSWNVFISNQQFKLNHSNFNQLIESADEQLATFLDPNDPPLKCMPEKFGYSRKDAINIFPDIPWPTCADKIKVHKKIIDIDPFTNKLTMDCDKEEGIYYLGIDPNDERLGYEKFEGSVKEYHGKPVELKNNEEWAFGSCDTTKKTMLEGAVYSHRPNATSIKRTKEKMKEMQERAKEKYNSRTTKPLTVLMLVFDSLSRRHFYRKLPHTQEFLNNIDSNKFSVFDFKIHNVMGDNSLPNVYPVWTGKTLIDLSRQEKYENKVQMKDLIGPDAFWYYLKEKGWMTLFSTEFCDDYFSFKTGRKIDADHVMAMFWCAAERFSGFDDLGQTQRCIGNQNSHYHNLNYTYQFVHNYQGLNKWAHIMSLPGHEDSGTVISTLDDDLVEILGKLLEEKDETVIFLMADHGMRYGDWYKLLEGSIEHKLPMLFMIASNSLLDDIKNSYDSLYHNSFRLISKFDLHKSLKHLAHLPYYRGYTKTSEDYLSWEADSNKSMSLFLDKVPNDRSCADIHIEPFFCSCLSFEKIEPDVYDSSAELSVKNKKIRRLLIDIANYVIILVNEESTTSFKSHSFHICQRVTFKQIESVEWLKLDNNKHFYKIVITINENPAVRFESVAMVTSEYVTERRLIEGFLFQKVYLNGKRTLRMIYIRRQDVYGGLCEEMCKIKQIQPSLCICHKLDTIKYNEPSLVDTLAKPYTNYEGLAGESCTETCSKVGKLCDPIGINLLNTCSEAMRLLNCKSCLESEESSLPAKQDGVCYLYKGTRFSCAAKSSLLNRACACKHN
ncbi:unnamed protein product [Blepharisma stoltei]|uniref:Uncharacterized protein n=1 Tax=Blepharisma stoltei TaxID=1481888 RepID=A0AAU9J8E7_9CILI|nr:unnamed protein product [Blepharisma stoltei]